jgi:hypothetical protein
VPTKLRADSGLYSKGVVEGCEEGGSTFTLTAAQTPPWLEALTARPERRWRPLPDYEVADVAERRYQPVGGPKPSRYAVKRELAQTKAGARYGKSQARVTNDEAQSAAAVRGWHVQHADRGNAIKEHQSGFSLEKLPSQTFQAPWAYLLIGQLAFNLVAGFNRLVLPPTYQRTTSKTLRPHLFTLAGKSVQTARRCFLVISECYRYPSVWQFAIKGLATLQFA